MLSRQSHPDCPSCRVRLVIRAKRKLADTVSKCDFYNVQYGRADCEYFERSFCLRRAKTRLKVKIVVEDDVHVSTCSLLKSHLMHQRDNDHITRKCFNFVLPMFWRAKASYLPTPHYSITYDSAIERTSFEKSNASSISVSDICLTWYILSVWNAFEVRYQKAYVNIDEGICL